MHRHKYFISKKMTIEDTPSINHKSTFVLVLAFATKYRLFSKSTGLSCGIHFSEYHGSRLFSTSKWGTWKIDIYATMLTLKFCQHIFLSSAKLLFISIHIFQFLLILFPYLSHDSVFKKIINIFFYLLFRYKLQLFYRT